MGQNFSRIDPDLLVKLFLVCVIGFLAYKLINHECDSSVGSLPTVDVDKYKKEIDSLAAVNKDLMDSLVVYMKANDSLENVKSKVKNIYYEKNTFVDNADINQLDSLLWTILTPGR